jgi:streptogramin lyase
MNKERRLYAWATVGIALVMQVVGLSIGVFGSSNFVVQPGRQVAPLTMLEGPDHNLWFTEFEGERIGRITSSGTITQFSIAGAQSLVGLAIGSDGNIWFTDQYSGIVGHITTSGGGLTRFALPTGSHPQGLCAGRDNNLWFVDQKSSGLFTIGRITPSGAIKEFSVGKNAGPFQPYYYALAQIAPGPDGNLWFTNPQASTTVGNFIGKITTAGVVATYSTADTPLGVVAGPDGNVWAVEFSNVAKITVSGAGISETEHPLTYGGGYEITVGPDGDLWFTESTTIAKITTGGALTEFPPTSFAAYLAPAGITSGPDGNVWFTGWFSSNIGKVSTSGTLLNTYALDNGSGPREVTLGPDGAVWFTDNVSGRIGRISTTGTVSSFAIPTSNSAPLGIVTGSDQNLWFVERHANQIAKITPSGIVTEYPLGTAFRGLHGIAAGPDGNLWFTEGNFKNGNKIGRITTSGVITGEFPLPTAKAQPLFIVAGPDGNLWFTEFNASKVGRITPTGTITEFPVTPGSYPGAITVGPDHKKLWFLENTAAGAVSVLSTSGVQLSEHPVSFTAGPEGLVSAPDGAVWLAQWYPNGLARVTPTAVVSQAALTVSNAGPNALTVGSDGKLWVVDYNAGQISRLSAIGGTGANISATHGTQFKGAVASFVDGTPTAKASDFTASINWGDGSKSAGIVTGANGGPFTITGSHTYANAGSFNLTVTLTDGVDKAAYNASGSKATIK